MRFSFTYSSNWSMALKGRSFVLWSVMGYNSDMKAILITFIFALASLAVVGCGRAATPIPTATAQPAPTHTPVPTATAEPTPVPTATAKPAPTSTALPAPTPVKIQPRAIRESGKAHDFEIETFDGEMLRLSDLEGKVVVLNFWASWCPPCRWEMPFFEEMNQEYKDQEVVFLGVAMSDTLDSAKEFAESAGVTYPIGLDTTNDIARNYKVISLPTTFFIGRDGNIERRLVSAANEGVLKIFLRGQLRPRN